MLRHLAITASAILAIGASAGAAKAVTFVPNGSEPTSFTLTGTLTLQQSTTIRCAVRLNGMILPGGSLAYIYSGSFTSGDWQCGWLVYPNGFTWILTPSWPSQVTVSGVSAATILGSCSGTLSYLTWTNGPPSSVTMYYASIPGSPSACTISGTLTSSPQISIM
jgi:hypothetical protein